MPAQSIRILHKSLLNLNSKLVQTNYNGKTEKCSWS